MNKRKIGTGLLALALVGFIGIGGSLAWFTDQENVTNTFNTGFIGIGVDEVGPDGEIPGDGEGIEYDDVKPGDELDKIVTVTLDDGSEEAWVRLIVTLQSDNQAIVNSVLDEDPLNNIKLLDSYGDEVVVEWEKIESDGKIAAQAIIDHKIHLNDENNTWTPFAKVEIPNAWGNDEAKSTFTLDVKAQAVQYDHNEANGFDGISDDEIQTFEE